MTDWPRPSRFFLLASYALLAIVLVGFAPTFYLRDWFGAPGFPGYVFAHGVILTAWYGWFCVQTTAVALGRVDLHRRLGAIGIVLAVPVVVSGAAVALGYGPRMLGLYGAAGTDATRVAMVVWGNLGMLAAFVVFLAAAVFLRRRADVHRRLMFLAAVSLVPPALARIARNPWMALPEQVIIGGGLAVLLLALALTDHRQLARPHRATLIGGGALGGVLAVSVAIGRTDIGRSLAFLLA
jgi:hypothetical protein